MGRKSYVMMLQEEAGRKSNYGLITDKIIQLYYRFQVGLARDGLLVGNRRIKAKGPEIAYLDTGLVVGMIVGVFIVFTMDMMFAVANLVGDTNMYGQFTRLVFILVVASIFFAPVIKVLVYMLMNFLRWTLNHILRMDAGSDCRA